MESIIKNVFNYFKVVDLIRDSKRNNTDGALLKFVNEQYDRVTKQYLKHGVAVVFRNNETIEEISTIQKYLKIVLGNDAEIIFYKFEGLKENETNFGNTITYTFKRSDEKINKL